MHLRSHLSAALAAAVTLILSLSADAEIIYSQTTPKEPISAFGSEDSAGLQKVADNFVINGDERVVARSLRFVGGYADRTPPPFTPPVDLLPADKFRIVFFEDDAGVPGMELPDANFDVAHASVRAPTNRDLLNGSYEPVEYWIDLNHGVPLDPENTYWLAITNAPDEEGFGWLWARADGQLDMTTAGTRDSLKTGPWDAYTNGGMFFELRSDRIPEPSSGAVISLLLGVALLMQVSNHSGPSL
jgi:hypothetical protein